MFNLPKITKWILGLNCGIWLLCSILPIAGHARGITIWEETFALSSIGSPFFRIWQPVTYMFMHDMHGIGHLFFNMLAVLMFGPALERKWGEKRYALYYAVCGIGAGLIQLLVWYLLGTPGMTVGASGAVFGILFAFAWFFPDVEMFLLFIPVPIRARVFVLGYAVLELIAGVAQTSGVGNDNIAHFAHLGGMLFGWILLLIWHMMDRKRPYDNGNWGGFHYQPRV